MRPVHCWLEAAAHAAGEGGAVTPAHRAAPYTSRASLRNLLRWLWLIYAWAFRGPRLVWLTLFVLVIAALLVWWWKSEPAFRITGMVLQLLGLGTVAWGVRKTRELFGRPGMFKRFVEWWRGRPRYHPSVVTSTATASGTSNVAFVGEVWSEVGPDAYIEIRLAVLEKNLLEMRRQFNGFAQETRTNLNKHTNDLRQETQVRGDEDRAIRAKLEDVGVGGLDISVMGIVWLGVGVIMSSLSLELAAWIWPVRLSGT